MVVTEVQVYKMEKQDNCQRPIFQAYDCGDKIGISINDCTIDVAMYALSALVENIVISAISSTIDYDTISHSIIKAVNVGLDAAKKELQEVEHREKN